MAKEEERRGCEDAESSRDDFGGDDDDGGCVSPLGRDLKVTETNDDRDSIADEEKESTRPERKSEARESSSSSFRFSLFIDAVDDAAIETDDEDVLGPLDGVGIISGGGILKRRRRSMGSSFSRKSPMPR